MSKQPQPQPEPELDATKDGHQHPVLDSLSSIRSSTAPSAALHLTADPMDQLLQATTNATSTAGPASSSLSAKDALATSPPPPPPPPVLGPSTAAALQHHPGWTPLKDQSDNTLEKQQSQKALANSTTTFTAGAQSTLDPAFKHDAKRVKSTHDHEKASFLPDLAPGFKDRMADIHRATFDSINLPSVPTHTENTDADRPNHTLSKNSILYESSAEDQTKADQQGLDKKRRVSVTQVEGGSHGRRWSHELSVEKAGLVGAAIETAGLVCDVILDKVRPLSTVESSSDSQTSSLATAEGTLPSSSSSVPPPTRRARSADKLGGLTLQEKQAAARMAFGGGDELGDNNIFNSELHIPHLEANQAGLASATAEGGLTAGSAIRAMPSFDGRPISAFYLAANPEQKRDLLLHNPESLGYHPRDPSTGGQGSP